MFEQKKITYKMKLLSSLAKVFQDEELYTRWNVRR